MADNPLKLLALLCCLAPTARALPQTLEQVGEVRVDGGRVTALAFSPDGRWLASGGELGEVFLWNLRTRERRLVLEVSDRSINRLSFDAAGEKLAVLDRQLSLWNVETGELLARQWDLGEAMDRSPDGRLIASMPNNKVLVLRDAETLEEVRSLHVETDHVKSAIAFSPDGSRLLVADVRGGLEEIDLATGLVLAQTRASGRVRDLLWLDDDKVIAAASNGVVDFGDRRLWLEVRSSFSRIAASEDGDRIAIGSWEKTAVLDAEGQQLEELGPCTALAMHPDGHTLALANDGEIEVRSGNRILFRLRGHYLAPDHMAFAGDGRYLAVARYDGGLWFHDLRASESKFIDDLDTPRIWSVHGYTEGSEILVHATDDVAFWSPTLGTRVRVLSPEVSKTAVLSYDAYSLSSDGRWLVSGNVFHDLYDDVVWRPFAQKAPGAHVLTQGRMLITASTRFSGGCAPFFQPVVDSELRTFDLNGNELARRPYRFGEAGTDISLTADGTVVAVALQTGVGFFDPATLEELDGLPARARFWRSLDDDFGVSFGEDGLELWDLHKRKPVHVLDRFHFDITPSLPPPELLPVYQMEVSRHGLLALKSRDRILLYRLNKS